MGATNPLKLARQATSATVTGLGFQNSPPKIGKLPLQGANDSHDDANQIKSINTPSSTNELNNSLTHKDTNIVRGLTDLSSTKALKLDKRTSIRAIDIANITRKERQDLIDEKVMEFETNME